MSETPALDDIAQRLLRAQEELVVALRVGEATVPMPINALPQHEPSEAVTSWEAYRRRLDLANLASRLASDGAWETDAPAFQGVQQWVEIYWNIGRATEPPPRTAIAGDHFSPRSEAQLDAAAATRKLIVAAALHGAEAVARYATEFARHGMIETRSVHLLKGPPISEPKRLDDYCSLLPYRDALRLTAPPHPDETLPYPWPSEDADNVCALECASFERRTFHGIENELFTSPLLRYGVETLALMLGLVWGNGLRLFGSWSATPAAAKAALPFPMLTTGEGGRGTHRIELALQGWGPQSRQRPLAVAELAALMERYAALPYQFRRRMALALRRLRDSTERVDYEDRVIDMCIALEALFMDEEERQGHRKIIARRGSWYFADSVQERERTRSALEKFYDLRSSIVHGARPAVQPPTEEAMEEKRRDQLIAVVMDMARASLKDMVAEGTPVDWEKRQNSASIWRDPPRNESDIQSVKSDSLSWTVKEQKEIDRALESVWRPTVDKATPPPSGTGVNLYTGIHPEIIEEYRRKGGHYVIRHPARLYMAHPKWPKTASDPLDERTEYYCEKDVEKHMHLWREAAIEKRLSQFELPCRASLYHPKHREAWARPLQ